MRHVVLAVAAVDRAWPEGAGLVGAGLERGCVPVVSVAVGAAGLVSAGAAGGGDGTCCPPPSPCWRS